MEAVLDTKEPVITVAAVGDLSFGDHPLCLGFGVRSQSEKHGPLFPLERVRERLLGYDVLVGNLETVLSDSGLKRSSLESAQLRGMPSSVECLASAGFTAVNLANNHAMQHGERAFRETLGLLGDRGIKAIGLLDDRRRPAPVVVETKGIKLGLLGYSLRPRQYFMHPPLYAEGKEELIIEDVASLAKTVNFVVVSLHWGHEFVSVPSPDEIQLAKRIVDAGASIIIGHHPHVLRPIELYHGAVICYSLGNFLFDMTWLDEMRLSCIVEIICGSNKVLQVTRVPIFIDDQYQPDLANGKRASMIDTMLNMAHHDKSSSDDYEQLRHQHLKRQQWSSRLHFLKNLYRYRPSMAAQLACGWLRNRTDRNEMDTIGSVQQ